MRRYAGLLLATVSTAALAPAGAYAQVAASPADVSSAQAPSVAEQGFSDEIVVTAQRREESLQDVPISINAFSANQLQELRIDRPAEIAALAPGTFVSGSRGDQNPIFSIRGLSLNDTFSNNNPTVGIYFDEVIQPFTPMLGFQMFDLARVEVLKGPQGTLYGRNTTGGAINFISRRPSDVLEGYATASYSRFNRFELEAAVGGPIADTLSFRLSAKATEQTGGWQTNALTGEEIGDVSRASARAQLLWTPTPALDVLLKGTISKDNSDQQLREHVGYYAGAFGAGGFCAPALAGRRDEGPCVDFLGYFDPTEDRRTVENSAIYGYRSNADAWDLTLIGNYDLGGATLTSVTGYNSFDRVAGDDSDGAALIELDSRFTDKIRSFTQEVRLTSDNNSPLSWVGGLFYSWDEIDGATLQALDDHIFRTRVDTRFIQTTESYAAFGQATYSLTEALRLTAGLRYTHETKGFVYDSVDLDPFGTTSLPTPVAGIVDELSEDNLSGKIGIDYDVTRNILLYASASRGFKSGGYKAAIAFNPEELVPFGGETVDAFEAGAKTTLGGGRLVLNFAGFYYDWHDFQALVTEIRSGINVIVLSNAGDARVYGGEFDAQYRATDRLQLRASASLMDSKITNFNNAPGSPDFTGNTLANSPDFSFSGSVRWELPIQGNGWGSYVLGDASYRSRIYYSLANRLQNSQDGYWLANARVAVAADDGAWEAALFARNIFNKLYVSQSYDNWGGIFPSQNFLGDPVTYGASITIRY